MTNTGPTYLDMEETWECSWRNKCLEVISASTHDKSHIFQGNVLNMWTGVRQGGLMSCGLFDIKHVYDWSDRWTKCTYITFL